MLLKSAVIFSNSFSFVLFSEKSAYTPQVRKSKTVLDSGFYPLDSGFKVLDSGFFVIKTRIPDYNQ